MNKALLIVSVLVASCVFAAPDGAGVAADSAANSRLISARSQIAKIIAKPKMMTAAMKNLSSSQQLTFVGDVNKAISKMSVSENERAAIALNVNRAAIDGAAKGNLASVVAEIFATAPLSSLTVINESFSTDVFNRAANPKVTYTDDQFIEVATKVMETIVARLESASDAGVRGGFAALMMIRASNTQSQAIRDAIVATLPASVQETAKNEWLPAALAQDDSKSYDPMLGMAEEEVSRPVTEQVLRIAGPQQREAMLSDLSGAATDPLLKVGQATPVISATFAPVQDDLPNNKIGDGTVDPAAAIDRVKNEISGYQWQTTK